MSQSKNIFFTEFNSNKEQIDEMQNLFKYKEYRSQASFFE